MQSSRADNRHVSRLPDKPKEVSEAFDSLREHLAGVGHIRAMTTWGPPSFLQWRLCVIGDPGIQWDLVPDMWQGYEVEKLWSGPLPKAPQP
jgi:hypothetical protein